LIIKPRNNWQTFSLVDIINYLNRRLHVEVFDPFIVQSIEQPSQSLWRACRTINTS